MHAVVVEPYYYLVHGHETNGRIESFDFEPAPAPAPYKLETGCIIGAVSFAPASGGS